MYIDEQLDMVTQYTYTHAHTHTYMSTCLHAHTQVCTELSNMVICMHNYRNTKLHEYMHIPANMYSFMQTCRGGGTPHIYTCTSIQVYATIVVYMRIYICVYLYMYKYKYM